MDSGMIGKIEKAKRYAEEKDRITINNFQATFKGDNNDHVVQYEQGKWTCDCTFFKTRGVCVHTMALEMVLKGMVANAEIAQS